MQSTRPMSAEVVDGTPHTPEIGSRGRMIRIGSAVVVALLLLYGNIAGNDDKFPFGPFKMYAFYVSPNAVITSTAVKAQTADGRIVTVTQGDTGVSHADLELELDSYQANPDRLGGLAATFHRRFPNASPFVKMWIVQTRWKLHDRAIVDRSLVTLVDWHAR